MQKMLKVEKNDIVVIYFSSSEYLGESDVVQLKRELSEKIQNRVERIFLFLNSLGGNPHAAYKFIKLLHTYGDKVICIVPHRAKSAAALIAIGSNVIVMDDISEIGPLDPQVEYPEGITISALDGIQPIESFWSTLMDFAVQRLGIILRKDVGLSREKAVRISLKIAIEYFKPLISKLDPRQINICLRYLTLMQSYGKEVLTKYMLSHIQDPQEREKIAEKIISNLVWLYPEHGYVIGVEEAKKLGLNVIHADEFEDYEKFYNLFEILSIEKKKVVEVLTFNELKKRLV